VELGGEAVPALVDEPLYMGGVYVASLVELWMMRARAFVVTRPGERPEDLDIFIWLMVEMDRQGVQYHCVDLLGMLGILK
jgi:hypothetical protein